MRRCFTNVAAAAQWVVVTLYMASLEHLCSEYGFSYDELHVLMSNNHYCIFQNNSEVPLFIVDALPEDVKQKASDCQRTVIMKFPRFDVTRAIDVIYDGHGSVDFVKRPDYTSSPATFDEEVDFIEWFTLLMKQLRFLHKETTMEVNQ
jgi:hypothetical protein